MGPKDREERQLMRQRGAGVRQVKNIGFDLVLPGQENVSIEPLQPLVSGKSRKTPQPELLPQRSSRRTPKPEKSQLQQSSRKTLAPGFTKKRGRPAKKAISDELEDLSRSRVTQADEEGITMKKMKVGKSQEEQADAALLSAPEGQGDGLGTTEATLRVAPSTGVKKRKKRKSIGQQSISRARATKARSPRKPNRQPRNKNPKLALAEVTDLDKVLGDEVQKGILNDAVPLDEGGLTIFPEIASEMDSGADRVKPSAEKLQRRIVLEPKKKKLVPVEDLPVKRVKAAFSQSKHGPKVSKTEKEIILPDDVFDAVQRTEKPAEVDAGSLRDVHEEQDAASEIARPQKEVSKKRKRVSVGQQSKKRVKAGISQIHRKQKAHNKHGSPVEAFESAQSVGKPAHVDVGSSANAAEEQEVTAGEPESQTQKLKPKRKKRKSVGQRKPKKKSMDHSTPKRTDRKVAAGHPVATGEEMKNTPTNKRGRPRAKQPLQEAMEESHAENLAHILDEEGEAQSSGLRLKNKPKAKSGRPKTNPVPEDAVDLPNKKASKYAPEEQDELQILALPEKKKPGRPRKVDAAQPTSQTTRPTKAPASRKPKPKLAPTASKNRAPPQNTVPITIYAPPSPTSDTEDDTLSTSHPYPTTNTINAVDVLSQLCSELLSKSSSTLAVQIQSNPSSASKPELKRMKETTDLYAKELASRLLQLTTTLNTNSSLRSRVRAATKEERELKKELKQLQKERENIRVRKEEVMKERKKRELDELLSGIAGAVKRGWDMQKEGEEGDAVAEMVEEGDLEV